MQSTKETFTAPNDFQFIIMRFFVLNNLMNTFHSINAQLKKNMPPASTSAWGPVIL